MQPILMESENMRWQGKQGISILNFPWITEETEQGRFQSHHKLILGVCCDELKILSWNFFLKDSQIRVCEEHTFLKLHVFGDKTHCRNGCLERLTPAHCLPRPSPTEQVYAFLPDPQAHDLSIMLNRIILLVCFIQLTSSPALVKSF